MNINKNNIFQIIISKIYFYFNDIIFKDFCPYPEKYYKTRENWNFTLFGTIVSNFQNFLHDLCCKTKCVRNYNLNGIVKKTFYNYNELMQYIEEDKKGYLNKYSYSITTVYHSYDRELIDIQPDSIKSTFQLISI
jgi:hypothetical protein